MPRYVVDFSEPEFERLTARGYNEMDQISLCPLTLFPSLGYALFTSTTNIVYGTYLVCSYISTPCYTRTYVHQSLHICRLTYVHTELAR